MRSETTERGHLQDLPPKVALNTKRKRPRHAIQGRRMTARSVTVLCPADARIGLRLEAAASAPAEGVARAPEEHIGST